LKTKGHSVFRKKKYELVFNNESHHGELLREFRSTLFTHIYTGKNLSCLGPRDAGSNPVAAIDFNGDKNPQHTFLRIGSKAAGPVT
jgi:hypothetical protein